MTNNYFPFKKVVLFCCFSLMLAMKPRALHTIRRFRKRLSKKVQKVLSFQMRRLHCFHLCQKLPQKIHITLCRKSPKLCSWIEVLLLFVLNRGSSEICFIDIFIEPTIVIASVITMKQFLSKGSSVGVYVFLLQNTHSLCADQKNVPYGAGLQQLSLPDFILDQYLQQEKAFSNGKICISKGTVQKEEESDGLNVFQE